MQTSSRKARKSAVHWNVRSPRTDSRSAASSPCTAIGRQTTPRTIDIQKPLCSAPSIESETSSRTERYRMPTAPQKTRPIPMAMSTTDR